MVAGSPDDTVMSDWYVFALVVSPVTMFMMQFWTGRSTMLNAKVQAKVARDTSLRADLQTLQARNDALERKNLALESRNDQLDRRINFLISKMIEMSYVVGTMTPAEDHTRQTLITLIRQSLEAEAK